MRARRSFIRALATAGAIIVFLALTAVPALAAEATGAPSPSPTASVIIAEPGPPASYYASYGLIAIGGLTLLAVLAGYLFQAPGFRRSKGASS